MSHNRPVFRGGKLNRFLTEVSGPPERPWMADFSVSHFSVKILAAIVCDRGRKDREIEIHSSRTRHETPHFVVFSAKSAQFHILAKVALLLLSMIT